MLLRRITQHVQNQNWFAVFIDFLIVVVGVFIGIQVANWNETRLENQLSADFTERLRDDIFEEAWDFEYMIEYYTDVQQNAERVLADLESGKQLKDIDLVIAAYRASQINIITRRRSTYDELVSIGKMDLIKDQLLRDTAIAVYEFPFYDSIYTSGYESKYREIFRMHIHSEVQMALSIHCGDKNVEPLDYQGIIDSIDYPCDPLLNEDLVADAAATIRTHELFLPYLRLRLAQLQASLYSLKNYYPELTDNLKKFRGAN
ncbi:DUF6090 family protein [Marinicella sp. S1101]|uniref:DUF6090 family protein n=1 Tax=Marinicella marina TaxID=2996016 RepID=UPI0022609A68|nr:DUF6090 family protein [Marinicella marina]MCX7554750.1 DUF6090 family protein [Marinicella marina]MDJ1141434.1 DUF6090 family protein [Marinicella marina]